MSESRPRLRLFETRVYGGDLEAAMRALPDVISEARADSTSSVLNDQRFAIALIELLGASNLALQREQFSWLCLYLPDIRAVFAAAGLDSTEFMARPFMRLYANSWLGFPDQASLMQGLLFWDPMAPRLDLVATAQQHPQVVAAFLLSVLNFTCILTRESHSRFERLLQEYWPGLETVIPDPFLLRGISNPWMYCSYAGHDQKHRIKQTLNRMLGNFLAAAADAGSCNWHDTIPRRSSKQRILVPLEQFKSSHAMYRCFGRVIRQLGERFHTVALVRPDSIDEESRRCFSEVWELDEDRLIASPRTHIARLRSCQFDAVYYPSLGMNLATLLLANQRIAPIQCMTLGHPATSAMESMDYVIVQEQDFATAEVFSETVLLSGNETSSTMPDTEGLQAAPDCNSPEPIHIAIVSSWLKLNYPFLQLCMELAELCKRPLRFHLFTGAQGIVRRELTEVLRRYPLAVDIEPAAEFGTYLQQLARCHIRLGTFPFGGANSNMDCFALGIPSLVMAGTQPHSQSDVGQMQRAGLECELVDQDAGDYLDTSRKLIEDDDYRKTVSTRIRELRDNDFFSGEISGGGKFLHTFSWMMQHHQDIQAAGRKVWGFEDQHDDIGCS
ncbi:MAG: hypothetical protein RL120_03380 [Gammaproteobacteria bacterium]